MAAPFVLDAQLRLTGEVLGLNNIKQQLAGISNQIGQTVSTNISAGSQGATQSLLQQTQAANQAASANNTLAQSINKTQQSLKPTSSALNTTARASKDFGDSILLAGRRYAAFIAATSVAFKAIEFIGGAVNSVVEFDSALTKVNQILDPTTAQLQLLQNTFLELSVSTGTSAKEIAELAQLLASAGFDDFGEGAAQGRLLTDTLEELAKVPLLPAFESSQQAAEGFITILAQFDREGLTASDILNKLNESANRFAVTSQDIIEGAKRGGSALATLGVSFDEFIGLFTAVRETTRESASTIGTALKTIAPRLVSPKITEFLKSIGVETTNAKNQFIGLLPLLDNIRDKFVTLDAQGQVQLAEKLGGQRQIARLLALLNNFDRVDEIANVSRNSFNSVNQDVEKGLNTVSKQLDILTNTAQKLAIELGPTIFVPAIQGLTELANIAINVIDSLKPIIPVFSSILTIGGAITALRIGQSLIPRGLQFLGGLAGASSATALAAGVGGSAATAAGGAARATGGLAQVRGLAENALFQQALLGLTSATIESSESLSVFAKNTLQTATLITSALSLLSRQSVTGFFATGGLLKSLGGLGGALTGAGILGGAFASSLIESRNQLVQNVVSSANELLSNLKITDAGIDIPASLLRLDFIRNRLVEVQQQLSREFTVQTSDPIAVADQKILAETGERVQELLGGVLNFNLSRIKEAFSFDFSTNRERDALKQVIEGQKDLILRELTSVATEVTAGPGEVVDLRSIIEKQLGGAIPSDVFIDLFGGIDKVASEIVKQAEALRKQELARALEDNVKRVTNALQDLVVPPRLTGELVQLSRVIQTTTDTINSSISTFEDLLPGAVPGGVGRGPVAFEQRAVQNAINVGSLDEVLRGLPAARDFIQGVDEINQVLDNFIIQTSRSSESLTSLNLTDRLDQFIDQENLPSSVADVLEFTFQDIAKQFEQSAEEGAKFIDPSKLRDEIRKRLADVGLGAQPAIVEEVTKFVETSFRQIEDNVNRLSRIRSAELEASITQSSRLSSLVSSLGRAGVPVGQRQQVGFGPNIQAFREAGPSSAQLSFTPLVNVFGQVLQQNAEQIRLQRQLALQRGGVTPQALQTTALVEDRQIREQLVGTFLELQQQVANASIQLSQLSGRDLIEAQQNFQQLRTRLLETGVAISDLTRNVDVARRVRLEEQAIKFAESLQEFDRETQDLLTRGGRGGGEGESRFLEDRALERQRLELGGVEQERAINEEFDTILEGFKQAQVDSIKIFDDATRIQSDASTLFQTSVEKFDLTIAKFGDVFSRSTSAQPGQAIFQNRSGSSVDLSAIRGTPDFQTAAEDLRRGGFTELAPVLPTSDNVINQQAQRLDSNTQAQENTRSVMERLSDSIDNLLNNIQENQQAPSPVAQPVGTNAETGERQISATLDTQELQERLQSLITALSEPGNIRLDAQNRFDINIEGIDADLQQRIVPLLRNAAEITAKDIIVRAFRSLANRVDTESQIAFNDVANELGNA